MAVRKTTTTSSPEKPRAAASSSKLAAAKSVRRTSAKAVSTTAQIDAMWREVHERGKQITSDIDDLLRRLASGPSA